MIPAQFDYLAPTTVEEALAALAEHGDDAKILAGGQSLLPVLRMRLNAPEVVIDLGKIPELRGVRDDGDHLVIGAMTRHADVLRDPMVAEHAALLQRAVTHLADEQIRHRGTFGGALAHADPAGDVGAPALALGCEMVIAGRDGTRTVGADDFFVDLFETAVGEDEILTAVRVPKHTGWTWGRPRCVPARSRTRCAVSRPPRTPCARPPRAPRRAPTRPRTSTATPTTAATSPPC